MFNLHISITNPWRAEKFVNLFNRSGMISKYKAWEFECVRHSIGVVKISVQWSARCDHAGPRLDLSLVGYSVSFQIYDIRHWDYQNKCWEIHDVSENQL